MSGVLGSIRIGKTENGIWQTANAFNENSRFFKARGIHDAAELSAVVDMVPGSSELTTNEFIFTYGFSVNFLSRRVSGYAMRVSSKIPIKTFYYPNQRETIICMVSIDNPTVTDKDKLAEKLYNVQSYMDKQPGLWSTETLKEGETRAETDRRLFFQVHTERRVKTLYLYAKVTIPSQVSQSEDTVETYRQKQRDLDTICNQFIRPAARIFFDTDDFDVKYEVMTNTIDRIGSNYYFLNEVTIVDYETDTMLLFNNFERTMSFYLYSSDHIMYRKFSDIFTTKTHSMQRKLENTRFVALESPIADARLDNTIPEGTLTLRQDIEDFVDYKPEMSKTDEVFHKTISYLAIQFNEHPRNFLVRDMTPDTRIIQQGPVYWTSEDNNLSFLQKVRLSTRTNEEWMEVEGGWKQERTGLGPLDFALSALKSKMLPITEMKFTETGVKFPTSVLAEYAKQKESQDNDVAQTNGY